MRTVHPLAAAYLADLDRRLSGADPAERADIVDAVREHVDAAVQELGSEPTADDVRRILATLGPVDDVAAAWDPDVEHSPVPVAARRSATDSPVGIVLVALGGLALGLVLAPVALVAWFLAPVVVAAAVAALIGWRRGSAAWRTAFVLLVPVVVVTTLAAGAATLFFAGTVAEQGTPEPIVSAPAAP